MEQKRKNSKKRTAILHALSSTREHPTAEMLYTALKPEIPELSLGTVYRNLSVLVADGFVSRVAHVAGQERYDAHTEPHAHFVCNNCGRVIDVDFPEMIKPLFNQISDNTGCVAESYVLSFNGVCNVCKNKLNN